MFSDYSGGVEMANDIAIEARNICKTYDNGIIKVEALKNISMTVKKGEMVAVMGPSGCGKTTLLNCLSGLDDYDSGTVMVEGVALESMSDDAKTEHRAKRMGFVFQFFNLLPVLTAVENVELPLLVSGVPPKVAREKALKVMEQVGLLEWANHKPAELSGGQQQRVTIARSLVNDPAIIWADEPTGNLDSENSKQIMQLLHDLNVNKKVTIICVSHDAMIAKYSTRLIKMRNGRIISDSNIDNTQKENGDNGPNGLDEKTKNEKSKIESKLKDGKTTDSKGTENKVTDGKTDNKIGNVNEDKKEVKKEENVSKEKKQESKENTSSTGKK
jgi:putative ABC transport system ATP-binding protein